MRTASQITQTSLSASDQAEYRLEALKLAQDVAKSTGKPVEAKEVLANAKAIYGFIIGSE